MTSNPLISVTVCVRDGVDWVDGCIESLRNQTYRPLEIIAVDDGSTDGSRERLKQWHSPDNEVPVSEMAQDLLRTYKYGWKTSYYQNTYDFKSDEDVEESKTLDNLVGEIMAAEEEDCESCKI